MKKKHIAGGLAAWFAASKLTDKVFTNTTSREGVRRYASKKNGGVKRYRLKYGNAPRRGTEFIRLQPKNRVTMRTTTDGLTMHGFYYHAENPKRIILMAHGYAGSIESFCGIAEWLYEQDCDMLIIQQRATGQSEGEWTTFGALERLDLLDWLMWIHDRNDGNLPVYVYGTSMGASTALMAAGFRLPDDVAGIIADSAYTSMNDIVAESLKRRIRFIPVRTTMKVAEYKCISKAGFDIRNADAEKALRHCETPVLFIHGTADQRVSYKHSYRNYQADACDDKELLIVKNANHVCSWFEDPERYRKALSDFFEKHDKL